VIKLKRENQGNRTGKKNKNQGGTQITLEEELKSGISKDQRDEFPMEDGQFSSGLSIIV